MDLREALGRSFAEFDRRLAFVDQDRWVSPTPCEGWTVRELVDHMWFGCDVYVQLFEGRTYWQAFKERPPTLDPASAIGQYRRTVEQLSERFRAPGALEQVVRYPMREHTVGADLVVFRLFDNVVHTWDLARSLNCDEHMDDALVDVTYAHILPHLELWREAGHMAPGLPIANDASTQTTLLRLCGRDAL